MAPVEMGGATAPMALNDIMYDLLAIRDSLLTCFLVQPFGVGYSGASYKYTVLDTKGGRSAAQGVASPCSADHSLIIYTGPAPPDIVPVAPNALFFLRTWAHEQLH